MKDFFISSTDNKVKICNETGSDSSLPVLIRLNQQNKDLSYNIGYMGNQNLDFDFRCRHYSLFRGIRNNNEFISEETDNFEWILKKLSHTDSKELVQQYPIFKKEDIFSRFLVLEIPDYGAQSMSPFFRDFVPHIYIDGLKLWQKYVGMIRHYSKRKAYILIDKGIATGDKQYKNNLEIDTLNSKNIVIRICFKNRVEKQYKIGNDRKDTDIGVITLSGNNCEFSAENQDVLLHGSFDSESFNSYIGDYLFEVKKGNSYYFINPLFIESLKFVKREGSNINRQTGINKIENNDYFKQYKRNSGASTSGDSENIEITRDTKVDITLKLKESFKDVTAVKLIPKSNFYDAVYVTGNSNIALYFGNDINDATISVFDENGSFKLNSERVDNIKYEIIPEYTTTRKFIFNGYEDTVPVYKSDIKATFPNLYHWNLKNNFIFGYNRGGRLIRNNIENIKNLIIYDVEIGEIDTDIEESARKNGDIKYICSTDILNRDIDSIESGMFTFVFEQNIPDNSYPQVTKNIKKIYFDPLDVTENNRCPLSFYMTKTNDDPEILHPENYDFTIICRCFPIKYEKMTLDNYTTLFKIPDYFIHDENLIYINDDDYNPKLSTTFLNATERCLYMSGYKGNLNGNYKIYDINHMNRKLTEMTWNDTNALDNYQTRRLVNTNCINFSGKNEVTDNN